MVGNVTGRSVGWVEWIARVCNGQFLLRGYFVPYTEFHVFWYTEIILRFGRPLALERFGTGRPQECNEDNAVSTVNG